MVTPGYWSALEQSAGCKMMEAVAQNGIPVRCGTASALLLLAARNLR